MFSGGQPTRLTAQIAGRYQISGSIIWDTSVGGSYRGARIQLNGTSFIASQVGASDVLGIEQTLSTLYDLDVGDYVELTAEQDSGNAIDVVKLASPYDTNSPEFMMVKVG